WGTRALGWACRRHEVRPSARGTSGATGESSPPAVVDAREHGGWMDREQADYEAQEVNALIVAAGRRERDLSGEELERVLGHVARVGFDPDARERVRGTI